MFTANTERLPAGHQDLHTGLGSGDHLREVCGRRDDVLEVVEHQQQVRRAYGVADQRDQVRVTGLLHAQYRSDGREDLLARGDPVQGNVRHSAVLVSRSPGEFDREAGLADAAGAQERDQAGTVLGQRRLGYREVLLSSEQCGGRVRNSVGQPCPVDTGRRRSRGRLTVKRSASCEGGVLSQYGGLGSPQCACWFETEFVVQPSPDLLVNRERVPLPAGTGKGTHPFDGEVLVHRMRGGKLVGLLECRRVLSAVIGNGGAEQLGFQQSPLQRRLRGLDERAVGHVGQWLTAVQAECILQEAGGRDGVACIAVGAGSLDEASDVDCVDVVGFGDELVAVPGGHDGVGAQRAAQRRDVLLDKVDRA